MSTLAALTISADRIAQVIIENGGEITPEIEDELTHLELDVADKIDRYDFIMDVLEARAKFLKERASKITAAARGVERAGEYLKDNIKAHLINLNRTEVSGNEIRFKLSNAKPKLLIEETLLNDKFKMIVSTTVPDKEKILAALNLGESVEGAQLIPSYSLRSYINKGEQK